MSNEKRKLSFWVEGGIFISKGIYKITNINNNKVYIGSSSDLERRFSEYKRGRYKKDDSTYGFTTNPKVFVDFRKFIKDNNGNVYIDQNYDYQSEIQKQINILQKDSS